MMRAIGWVICLTLVTNVVRGDEPAFQYFQQVQVPVLEQEELLAVDLVAEVFAATDEQLADVRIHDGAGRAVPYLRRQARQSRSQMTRQTWAGRNASLHPLDAGGLEITLRLGQDDPPPNGLTIVTPLRNFEQRLRVYSSADGQTWEPQSDETVVFDYSRFMDIRNDEVSFSQTGHQYFRIIIDSVTSAQESELLDLTRRLRGGKEVVREERVTVDRRDFRIDRIDFWLEQQQERSIGPQTRSYPIDQFHVDENAETQQTMIYVQTRQEPLTEFTVKTTTRNFSRRLVVEGEQIQGSKSIWNSLSVGTLSRIDFKNLQRDALAVSFPESRYRRYRLVVDNRDSPPIEITGIQSQGNVYQLLFLATPGNDYRVSYGVPESELPKYDTAAIEALLREGFQPAVVQLGDQQAAAQAPPEFSGKNLFRDARFLVTVIIILVMLLGWMLWSANQRLNRLPPEQHREND